MEGKIQNQLAQKKPEQKSMQQYIKSMEGEIKKALPSVLTPERFTRIVLSAISVNPKLGSCTPASFLGAMMTSAQLGLEVNTPLGQAYVLPYSNKGTLEAQFQLGYKGLIDLAYRSGEVESIQAHVVYENDEFSCEYGLEPKLVHKPADSDRGEAIKVYAVFKTKSGGFGFEVMSMEDVRKHAAKYSKAYGSSFSPWKTNFEEMAKKTVLKRVLKYAPLKTEFVRAATQDEVIKNTISDDMYDVPNENIIDAEFSEVVDAETGEVIGGNG
ncbi:MAG: recombinase RecT [Bacteroidaceae bacterium]|nr:recombinase RecT [Bacteroidaceae bacterium]